jgi:hypothetical protein
MNVASITDSATIQGLTEGFTAGFTAGFIVARSSPDAAPIGIDGLLAVLNRQCTATDDPPYVITRR